MPVNILRIMHIFAKFEYFYLHTVSVELLQLGDLKHNFTLYTVNIIVSISFVIRIFA